MRGSLQTVSRPRRGTGARPAPTVPTNGSGGAFSAPIAVSAIGGRSLPSEKISLLRAQESSSLASTEHGAKDVKAPLVVRNMNGVEPQAVTQFTSCNGKGMGMSPLPLCARRRTLPPAPSHSLTALGNSAQGAFGDDQQVGLGPGSRSVDRDVAGHD